MSSTISISHSALKSRHATLTRAQDAVRPVVQRYAALAPKRLHEILAINADTASFYDAMTALQDYRALVELTEKNARKIEHDARAGGFVPAPEAVELHDDFVVAAVHFLCAGDTDLASTRNGKGWNQADSGNGHVALALIDGGERAVGIAIGRSLIGKYMRVQLADLRA